MAATKEPGNAHSLAVERPNILIFMPDQLRYDALGYTGNSVIRTPNLDAFAARGVRFTNCYAQASVCTQSRLSMFTGRYSHVDGHHSFNNLLKPWEPNMFRSLKEHGYHVACLAPRGDLFGPDVVELSNDEYGFIDTPDFLPGNWKEGGQKPPPDDPHNIWHRLFYKGKREPGTEFDYDEGAVRSAEKWLQNPPKEPWCLFLPMFFPHCPFWAEEPYFSMYDRSTIPQPASHDEKTGHEPRYFKNIRERYGLDRAMPEMWAEVKAVYYAMITRLDDQFGRIVKTLDDTGLFDSTATLFFTDHGEYLGDSGVIEKWPAGLSDSLVHEPLLMAGAGLPAGRVVSDMAEMVDLPATLFELGKIPEHFAHNGKSWLSAILRNESHKTHAFSEGGFRVEEQAWMESGSWPYDLKGALQHEDPEAVGKAVAVRTPEWTYVYRLYEPPELYSRRGDDPYELQNLAGEDRYASVVLSFERLLLRWLVDQGSVLPWEKDPRFPPSTLVPPKKQLEDRKDHKS